MLGVSGKRVDILRCRVKETNIGIPISKLVLLYSAECGINFVRRRKGKTNFVSPSPEDYYPTTQREKIEVVSHVDLVIK